MYERSSNWGYSNGQFYQPIGVKRKFADAGSLVLIVSSPKLPLTLPVNTTRMYAKLLRFTLYAVSQKDQRKSNDRKAVQRMLMKLTPGVWFSLFVKERMWNGSHTIKCYVRCKDICVLFQSSLLPQAVLRQISWGEEIQMENSKKGDKCRHFYIFEISDCRFFVHIQNSISLHYTQL